MSSLRLFFFLLCLLLTFENSFSGSYSTFSRSSLDYDFANANPCFKTLTRDKEVGCSGSGEGYLIWLDNVEDYAQFVFGGQKPFDGHAVLLIPHSFVNITTLEFVANSTDVAGVVVYYSDGSSLGLSPDAPVPQAGFFPSENPHVHFDWNAGGQNLLDQSWPFPMYFVNDQNEVDYLLEMGHYNKQLRPNETPRYGLALNSFMWGSTNTATCLRRGHCLPVGSLSAWGWLGQNLTTVQEKSPGPTTPYIALTAAVDGRSLFPGVAPSAHSSTAAVAALLEVSRIITRQNIVDLTALPVNVMFDFFHGESFGYLGSRSLLSEVQNFTCKRYSDEGGDNEEEKKEEKGVFPTCEEPWRPDTAFTAAELRPANLKAVLALGQLGLVAESKSPALHLFHSHSTHAESWARELMRTINGSAGELPLKTAEVDTTIPPSPVHTFDALFPSLSLPLFHFADHSSAFLSSTYHSVEDGPHRLNATLLCQSTHSVAVAALTLLHTVAQTGSLPSTPPPSLSSSPTSASYSSSALPVKELAAAVGSIINCTQLSEVLDCLAANLSCPLLQTLLSSSRLRSLTSYMRTHPQLTQYPSVYRGYHKPTAQVHIISDLFNYYTCNFSAASPPPCESDKNCSKSQSCVGGLCVVKRTHYHQALSPALSPSDHSPSSLWPHYNAPEFADTLATDRVYAESTWDGTIGLLSGFIPHPTHALVFFSTAIASNLIVFITLYFLRQPIRQYLQLLSAPLHHGTLLSPNPSTAPPSYD